MPYFTQFQKSSYPLSDDVTKNLTNISQYTAIFSRLADDASFYTYYNARGDERFDTISNELYGTPDYYWTIPILNSGIINTWKNSTKSEPALRKLLERKYPGVALVFDAPEDIIGNFEIDEIVATAENDVYRVVGIYPSNHYIHCVSVSVDDTSGAQEVNPTSTIPFYTAPSYYLDSDDNQVPAYLGINKVTFEDIEREKNESYSRIKVIRPQFIYDIATQFEREMA